MYFEDLSEHAKHEVRRVAAAFGVKKWRITAPYSSDFYAEFEGYVGEILVDWIVENTGEIGDVGVAREDKDWIRVINYAERGWYVDEDVQGPSNPTFKKFMAYGLYRLGIENERLFAFLDHPLTAHEKLELRLSMPREFWLKEWFEGEGV